MTKLIPCVSDESRIYYCNCGKSYKCKASYKRHYQYECGKRKYYNCDYCDAKFTQKQSVKRHQLNVHSLTAEK